MDILKDIMVYFIRSYPPSMQDDLSNARLTKMIYLADWHQAINFGAQVSTIRWYFDNYGPFVWDVKNEAENNPSVFSVKKTSTIFGQKKNIFLLLNKSFDPKISIQQKNSIDHVINTTQKLNWSDFIKLVYSTHPIASSERYTFLNLIEKASEYNKLKKC